MPRLIDADALDEKLSALMEKYAAMGRVEVANDYSFVSTVLMMAPTIDAVPVVRCRECKQFNTATAMTYYKDGAHIRLCGCERMCQLRRDDDYCSYGERREGDA